MTVEVQVASDVKIAFAPERGGKYVVSLKLLRDHAWSRWVPVGHVVNSLTDAPFLAISTPLGLGLISKIVEIINQRRHLPAATEPPKQEDANVD